MPKVKTPSELAYERMLPLLYKTVYKVKPPESGPKVDWEVGYDPIGLVVYKIGKIKSKLSYRSWYGAKPTIYMVNNKDIYTEEDWEEARLKWAKEKMWKVLGTK